MFFFSFPALRTFIVSKTTEGYLIFHIHSFYFLLISYFFQFLITPLILKSCICLTGKLLITAFFEAILFVCHLCSIFPLFYFQNNLHKVLLKIIASRFLFACFMTNEGCFQPNLSLDTINKFFILNYGLFCYWGTIYP